MKSSFHVRGNPTAWCCGRRHSWRNGLSLTQNTVLWITRGLFRPGLLEAVVVLPGVATSLFINKKFKISVLISKICCCCSVTQSCLTRCNPMDCSTLGLPVHRQLPDFAQLHVHSVGDAIQPSHPLSPSPHAFNLSPHQGLFQWVRWVHLHIRWPEYWSFTFSINPFNEYSGLISFRIDKFDLLAVQRDSQESSPTPQFESINSLALILLYGPTLMSIHTWLLENP